MDFEMLKKYLFDLPESKLEFPFGTDTMVFKVMGKMFALISWQSEPLRLSLKCDPALSVHLREVHEAIIPGYHMSKIHWNTVIIDGSLEDELITEMIDHSYHSVVDLLPKRLKKQLEKNILKAEKAKQEWKTNPPIEM